jgi:hypothetical protein
VRVFNEVQDPRGHINRLHNLTIDSIKFEACFLEWVNTLSDMIPGQVIAIDGKTIRGAKEHGKTSPIHIVSSWS